MSFRFFLPLLSYPDATPRAGLLRAFDMAATMGGEITAVVHEVDIPDIHNALADALIDLRGMIAAAEAKSHASAGELVEEVNQLGRRFQLRLLLHPARTRPDTTADYLARFARTFDYALLIPAGHSDDQVAIAEAILFGSGGPAFVFPDLEATAHLESAAIAWDGSRAAARAVRDALPVLKMVKRATVLTVSDDKPIDQTSVRAVRDLLQHHEIESAHTELALADQSVGDALQQAAVDGGAGLLVMGAYGHNRIREFVLGGATRTVLANRRLPILMSH